MRLLSWNILQGGGKRAFDIADAIVEFKPDIAVLQEFRNGKNAAPILDACDKLDLVHNHIAASEARKNTVMIASKFPLHASAWDVSLDNDLAVAATIELENPVNGQQALHVLAGHLPQKKSASPLPRCTVQNANRFRCQPYYYRRSELRHSV